VCVLREKTCDFAIFGLNLFFFLEKIIRAACFSVSRVAGPSRP